MRTHQRTAAVGIVVPVRNEEELLPRALRAIEVAGRHVQVPCMTVVVLDRCTDGSDRLARRWRHRLRVAGHRHRALLVTSDHGRAGSARRLGVERLLGLWRPIAHRLWIATTDADTEVPAEWISAQIDRHDVGDDLWTSRVTVVDWAGRLPTTASAWQSRYDAEEAPVHGASLGINAATYLGIGGFPPVATGEDRALYEAALSSGASAFHDRSMRVVTSGRRHARAPAGFSGALSDIERSIGPVLPVSGAAIG